MFFPFRRLYFLQFVCLSLIADNMESPLIVPTPIEHPCPKPQHAIEMFLYPSSGKTFHKYPNTWFLPARLWVILFQPKAQNRLLSGPNNPLTLPPGSA